MLTTTQPANSSSPTNPSSDTSQTSKYQTPNERAELDHQGLCRLGRYLQAQNYQHVAVTPLTHSYNNRRENSGRARNLRDILGWSRPFQRETVSATEFELMRGAGILEPVGDHWRSTVRWARLQEYTLAHSAYPTDAEDAVFFGPDTYRFAQFIDAFLKSTPSASQHIKRAADVGCGSGAGAILIAKHCPAAQVLAVDINPKALQLTAVNAELAEATQLEPVYSNLLDNTLGEFDLIVANPPYMLDTQKRAYRHGGGKLGEGLSQQIINAALARLAPGGTLLLYTGVAIVDGKDPFLASLHARLEGQPCHWTYNEMDPDVFSDELLKPAYAQVERIAAVRLTLTKH